MTDWDRYLLERIAVGNPSDADDNESCTDAREKLIAAGAWSDDLQARHEAYLAQVKEYCASFK